MLCPICGTLNDDNLQFCCACGNDMYAQPQVQYQQPDYQDPNQQYGYQQTGYQQPYYQQPYYQPAPKKDPGKVLGIVGFSLAMGSFVVSDGVLLAIAGIIVSAIGFKKSKEAGFNNGFAKAGLISSIIVTAITLVILAIIIAIYAFAIIYGMGYSYL